MTEPYIDAFSLLDTTEIKCLDDGFVRLVDVMPRLALTDRKSIEYAIVRSARISLGSGIKDPTTDAKLIRYLIKNSHTSPLESVKFTFHIRCPLFVRTHLIRHRTANINEYSQRYSVVKDGFYHPSAVPNGIRLQSPQNKQGSIPLTDHNQLIIDKVKQIETQLDEIYHSYAELIQLGVAKEVARFCLSQAQYTELYFTQDLHNFLHFITLRADDQQAQMETVIYAKAMLQLVKPLIPTVIEAYDDSGRSLVLSTIK